MSNSATTPSVHDPFDLWREVFGIDLMGSCRASSKVSLASKVDATLRELADLGIDATLERESYLHIVQAGFNRATLAVAFALAQLAVQYHPITVRGLMYRAQAVGLFPDTSHPYYQQTARVILKLRRAGLLRYDWIVDSTRRRLKPSSWSGLADFAETAMRAYRKDFWSRQADYIEVFVEKDAMAGVIEPVTAEFDVHLNVIRGQVSETFVWTIAEEWTNIEKPIFAYYLGDHDPAGLKIESSLKTRLATFCTKGFQWRRLAITSPDFRSQRLQGFPVKRSTPGWRDYIRAHGDRCVELDALDPEVVRSRIRKTIEQHLNQNEWARLQEIEIIERQTLKDTMLSFKAAGGHDGAKENESL
jgi:hypothetical protein